MKKNIFASLIFIVSCFNLYGNQYIKAEYPYDVEKALVLYANNKDLFKKEKFLIVRNTATNNNGNTQT